MQQNLESKMENLSVPTAESSSVMEPIEQRVEGFIQQYNRLESKIEANEAVLDSLETRHYRLHEQMELIGEQNDFQARETQLAIDQLNYNLTEIQVQCEQALQRTVNIFLWEKNKNNNWYNFMAAININPGSDRGQTDPSRRQCRPNWKRNGEGSNHHSGSAKQSHEPDVANV